MTEEASAMKNKKNPNYKAAKKTVERWQKSSWCDRSHSTIVQHTWSGLDESEGCAKGVWGYRIDFHSHKNFNGNYGSYKTRHWVRVQIEKPHHFQSPPTSLCFECLTLNINFTNTRWKSHSSDKQSAFQMIKMVQPMLPSHWLSSCVLCCVHVATSGRRFNLEISTWSSPRLFREQPKLLRVNGTYCECLCGGGSLLWLGGRDLVGSLCRLGWNVALGLGRLLHFDLSGNSQFHCLRHFVEYFEVSVNTVVCTLTRELMS